MGEPMHSQFMTLLEDAPREFGVVDEGGAHREEGRSHAVPTQRGEYFRRPTWVWTVFEGQCDRVGWQVRGTGRRAAEVHDGAEIVELGRGCLLIRAGWSGVEVGSQHPTDRKNSGQGRNDQTH